MPTLRQDEEEVADLDDIPEECPYKKWKDGRSLGKVLNEPQRKAFYKELDVVKAARWVCQKAHPANFKQVGSYDLSSMFWQMATFTNLLGTEVHEVQEAWVSQKDLRAAYQVAKASTKDIHFFRVVTPIESLKIMGLKGIHSSEALQWWGSLTFWPWCEKEGQNKGTMVNHLQTMHYQLGLVCACCLDYFTTSTETMHHHTHVCKPPATGIGDNDDREKEDSKDDDNGNEDEEFEFKED